MDSPEERVEGRAPAEGAPASPKPPAGTLPLIETGPSVASKNHRQELKREVIDFVKLVAWFLIIFLGLKTYVIEAYEVQGPSMIPTLKTNERILVFKLPHELSQFSLFSSFEAISPGDVIVFDSPDDKEKRYVKRVIAVGPAADKGKTVSATSSDSGEVERAKMVNVTYEDGVVYVNNHKIEEAYLSPESRRWRDSDSLDLGPGQLYVLGDNRGVSKDSRSFDAIEDDAIIGRAVLRFWPLNKISLIR